MPQKFSALAIVTPPSGEPVSLTEAKAQCRVTIPDEDAYITSLIAVARERVEEFTRRALMEQEWVAKYADWPSDRVLIIPRPPLVSVDAVKYWDSTGTEITVSASDYVQDVEDLFGVVRLKDSFGTPSLSPDHPNPIKVEFTCGYGAAEDVPSRAKQAIMMMVNNWYDNRNPVIVGTIASKLPDSAGTLMKSLKVYGV